MPRSFIQDETLKVCRGPLLWLCHARMQEYYIFVKFKGNIYKQVIGIPMGCDCAPKVAD